MNCEVGTKVGTFVRVGTSGRDTCSECGKPWTGKGLKCWTCKKRKTRAKPVQEAVAAVEKMRAVHPRPVVIRPAARPVAPKRIVSGGEPGHHPHCSCNLCLIMQGKL